MKKYLFVLTLLFSVSSFAQVEDTYTTNVKKAIALYKGEESLNNIASDLLAKMPQSKKSNPALQKAIADTKQRTLNEAITHFRDKFSGDQIKEVIKDLSVKKQSYSGITNSFIRQWGISKRKYLTQISELYKKYQ
ncbi:MAG: hypothetical protein QM486_08245 [Flavobacteriaceae bacterium]